MFQKLFVQSPLLVFPLTALALFVVAFVTILARVLSTRAADWESRAQLPFAQEDHRHGR